VRAAARAGANLQDFLTVRGFCVRLAPGCELRSSADREVDPFMFRITSKWNSLVQKAERSEILQAQDAALIESHFDLSSVLPVFNFLYGRFTPERRNLTGK
jgi:hypothetical protein